MDWLDQYLDSLGDYKTMISPADTHIWGVHPKLNNVQQRMIFDASAQTESEYRKLVVEARREEEQHGASLGIGADPGSVSVPTPTITPTITPTPSITPTITPTITITPTVTPTITVTPTPTPTPVYPEWSAGASYNVGDIVKHEGINYECVTAAGVGVGPFGGYLDGSAPNLPGIVFWSPYPIVNSFAYLTYAPGGLFASFTGNIPENWVKLQNIGFAIIGSSATSIGPDAFRSNDLFSIRIPSNITSIGTSAFRDNVVLSTVILSNNITSIGNNAFNGCALTNVTLPDNLQSLANGVFKGNDINAISIPASVTSIGNDTFQGNDLASLIIPDSVISIGNDAFRDNTNLASVSCFVPFATFIGTNAFLVTASPLVIHVRFTDATWNALLGSGKTFQGNTNVTVLNDL